MNLMLLALLIEKMGLGGSSTQEWAKQMIRFAPLVLVIAVVVILLIIVFH